MFKNYYRITIRGNNVKRFIKTLYKLGISLDKIQIQDEYFYAKVDQENYEKIINLKTNYDVEIDRVYGLLNIRKQILKNSFFLFSILLGLAIIFVLSNFIFDIDVVHDDYKLREIVNNELDKYGIKKYSLVKNYEEIQKIKKNILDSNKNDIEWIEIERVGTKYVIRLEKRIINKLETESKIRHVVAKKSGIIKKIVAENGEIIKKINDYVTGGETIISGEIHRGEDVKENVAADGKVFAEVWYKVKVSLPIHYYEKKYTGKTKNVINFSFLGNEINLFKSKYQNKEIDRFNLFSDFFDMVTINFDNQKEVDINDSINLITSENVAVSIARNKIINKLGEEEYIISQKKLKTTLNNSTINIEVFFKVYENISDYKYYDVNKGKWYLNEYSLWQY